MKPSRDRQGQEHDLAVGRPARGLESAAALTGSALAQHMDRGSPMASVPARPGLDSGTPDLIEAFIRVVMVIVAAQHGEVPAQAVYPSPMLTVKQTATLMGMSRMTVIRKADAGELPCVIISRGTRKTMRRFPRAAIEDLAARGGNRAQVDLREYTAQWLAAATARISQTEK